MEDESGLFEALEAAREAGKDEVQMYGLRFNTDLDKVRALFAEKLTVVIHTQEQPVSHEIHSTSAADFNPNQT